MLAVVRLESANTPSGLAWSRSNGPRRPLPQRTPAEVEAEVEGVTCPLTGEGGGHVLAMDRVYALYEGAACNLAFCLRRRQRYAEVYI